MSGDLTVERSEAYNSHDIAGETAMRLNRRLAADFRERVRCITVTTPFSGAWQQQVEYCQFLASVCLLEERETKAGKGKDTNDLTSSQSGTLQSEESTLWEREEFCAKVIVEEGKINLILRTWAEFRRCVEQKIQSDDNSLSAASRGMAKTFEISLGVLLRTTLSAVEAMQTLDCRAMLEHISFVWKLFLDDNYAAVAGANGKESEKKISTLEFLLLGEGVAFYLLQYMFRVLDRLQEELLMDKFFDLGLHADLLAATEKVMALVALIPEKTGSPLSSESANQVKEFSYTACRCWAAMLSTETYGTKMAAFWPNGKADKQRFAKVMAPLSKAYVAAFPNEKKEMRPLTDAILRFG